MAISKRSTCQPRLIEFQSKYQQRNNPNRYKLQLMSSKLKKTNLQKLVHWFFIPLRKSQVKQI